MPKRTSPPVRLAPGDMVLAKMPRFPQWPAFIMPRRLIPERVWSAKRTLTPYCVIFIPDGDFYWMLEKTLEPLTPARLSILLAKVPPEFLKRHVGDDGVFLDKSKFKLSNLNEAIVAATKLKFTPFIKRILNVDSIEEELDPQDKADKSQTLDTRTSDEEKEHQLWLCRSKLQRSLIQRNQPRAPTDISQVSAPTPDELLVARLILHRLLDFPILPLLLMHTKIHKVVKCIARDPLLEYADSFKLHELCHELLHKWSTVIEEARMLREEAHKNEDQSALLLLAANSTDLTVPVAI